MAVPAENIHKSSRLDAAAAQARLQTVQSRLALAFTLSAVAETEILYGHADKARRLILKVRTTVVSMHYHLNGAGPGSAILGSISTGCSRLQHGPDRFETDWVARIAAEGLGFANGMALTTRWQYLDRR